MITDIVDHGDGDVRSGGRNAPTTPPAPVLPRPVRVLRARREAKKAPAAAGGHKEGGTL